MPGLDIPNWYAQRKLKRYECWANGLLLGGLNVFRRRAMLFSCGLNVFRQRLSASSLPPRAMVETSSSEEADAPSDSDGARVDTPKAVASDRGP